MRMSLYKNLILIYGILPYLSNINNKFGFLTSILLGNKNWKVITTVHLNSLMRQCLDIIMRLLPSRLYLRRLHEHMIYSHNWCICPTRRLWILVTAEGESVGVSIVLQSFQDKRHFVGPPPRPRFIQFAKISPSCFVHIASPKRIKVPANYCRTL